MLIAYQQILDPLGEILGDSDSLHNSSCRMENIENISSNIRISSKSFDNVKTPRKESGKATSKKPFQYNSTLSASIDKSADKSINRTYSSSSLSPSEKSFTSSITSSSNKEGVRRAINLTSSELIKKVQIRKEHWAREKELKARQHKLIREANMKKLQDDCDAANEARKRSADKQREFLDRQKKEEKDLLALSLAERAQLALDLEREAKARRRISVFLNNKMKKCAKQREREMQEEERRKELDLHASKRLDFLAMREAKKESDLRKRESLVIRGLKAASDRKVAEELAKKASDYERDMIDTRLENRIDDCNSKYLTKLRNRESLANRLNMWRIQRQSEQEEEQAEMERKREEYQLRQDDWKDIQRYKDIQAKRDRESLACRLEHWREEKDLDAKLKAQQLDAEQINRELYEQELEDVRAYEDSVKQQRKQSLMYRLDKAKKDKDFERGQQALQQVYLEEEMRFQAMDREDFRKYREELQAARRQSLQYRTQLAVRNVPYLLLASYDLI